MATSTRAVALGHGPTGPTPTPPRSEDTVRRWARYLPLDWRLDDDAFALRHRAALSVAVGLLLALVPIGLAKGEPIGHVLLELVPMGLFLTLAAVSSGREVAALSAAAALMTASSLLVHFTDGLIESHFLFFVILPLIALYQNWRPFALSIAFVVFHHAVIGTVAPETVYNHDAAIENPILWGIIHALFVIGLVVVLIVEWNFSVSAQRLAEERQIELQSAHTELVRAQKLESVGQLAAGIAHEINTPMQYIGDNTHFLQLAVGRLLGVAEAAERAAEDGATSSDREALRVAIERARLPLLSERAPTAAADALAGVENVSRIVTAMKRFSHPGTEHPGAVDVNDSITTTATICRNEWKYSADLVTELDPDLPPVEGRLGSLNQVWLNLIVNATHAIADRHGDARGTIAVSSSTVDDGRAVRVAVTDDGCGIAPENLEKVFDHFFTTKDVGRGTGQGLAIVHQVVVREHHGSIDVASTPGSGTTFTVTLPVHQPATPEGAP